MNDNIDKKLYKPQIKDAEMRIKIYGFDSSSNTVATIVDFVNQGLTSYSNAKMQLQMAKSTKQ